MSVVRTCHRTALMQEAAVPDTRPAPIPFFGGMMKKNVLFRCMTALLLLAAAFPLPGRAAEEDFGAIRLTINGKTLTATLEDSPAGRDFYAMLPLSLPLKDFNGTEKISDLPRRLSLQQAPEGCTPTAGTLAYYAPWGNLAIFYRDFSWSKGLIPLGRISSDMKDMAGADNGAMLTIERAD